MFSHSDIQFFVQFILSFSAVLVLLTYILRIPHRLARDKGPVVDYYNKGFNTNVPLDFFLVFIYLQISLYLIRLFGLTSASLWKRVAIVALVTCAITGGFCFYFLSYPKTSQIFSRWFHSVKYNSVLYDTMLLTITYALMEYLKKMNNIN